MAIQEWTEILSFLLLLILWAIYKIGRWTAGVVEVCGKWAVDFVAAQQEAFKQNTETIRDGFDGMKASIEKLADLQEKRLEKIESMIKDKK